MPVRCCEVGANGWESNVQDEDQDVKRAKRMQSNRESARRSRMRKQAECEVCLLQS